jgi:hypothetical protein
MSARHVPSASRRTSPTHASAAPNAQTRLDAVLRARHTPPLFAPTSCAPQLHLAGEHAPCGACVGCVDTTNSLASAFIVTSKSASDLGLDASKWSYVSSSAYSPMQTAAYNAMNTFVSGPTYANVYEMSYDPGYGATAMDAAMGGVAGVAGVTLITGNKLGPGLKEAMEPVYSAVEDAGPNTNTYIVPFRT